MARIERAMTDNAWAYEWSLRDVVAELGARQKFIKLTGPGRTGKSNASTEPCRPSGPTGGPRQQRRPPLTPPVTNLTAGYIQRASRASDRWLWTSTVGRRAVHAPERRSPTLDSPSGRSWAAMVTGCDRHARPVD